MPRTNLCIKTVKCIFIPQQTCPIRLSLCVSLLGFGFLKGFWGHVNMFSSPEGFKVVLQCVQTS